MSEPTLVRIVAGIAYMSDGSTLTLPAFLQVASSRYRICFIGDERPGRGLIIPPGSPASSLYEAICWACSRAINYPPWEAAARAAWNALPEPWKLSKEEVPL